MQLTPFYAMLREYIGLGYCLAKKGSVSLHLARICMHGNYMKSCLLSQVPRVSR